MTHQPYVEYMHQLLDGALPAAARRKLEEHLGGCQQCQATWAALSEVQRRLAAEPMAAPRPGFTGRFNARLAQRRSRPRLVWGGLALGLGAVGLVALLVPAGVALIASVLQMAQQPVTTLALAGSAEAVMDFGGTVLEGLLVAARVLFIGVLESPVAWAMGLAGLALAAVWLYVMRKLMPEVSVR